MTPCPAPRPAMAAALLLSLLLAPLSSAHGRIVDGVVAVVDNEAVTYSEVRQAASEGLGVDAGEADEILREERDPAKVHAWIAPLVDALLVRRELARTGQAVAEGDVDRAVESIRKQNGMDEGAFRKAIEAEGMSYQAYRSRLRWQLERSALLRSRKAKEVSVTVDEAREWFLQQADRYAEGGEVKLGVLVLPFGEEGDRDRLLAAHQAARAASALLAEGKKFDDLVRLLPERFPSVRHVPGDFMAEEDLPDDVRKEVRRLRTGEVSPPFFTEDGGRVVSVLARRGGRTPGFADVKEAVTEELADRRSEKAFTDLMVELRRDSVVEYRY